MSEWKFESVSATYQEWNFEGVPVKEKEPQYWDGVYTHIHWGPGQPAQDTDTFCGLNLWLWDLDKNGKHGLTFEVKEVDCPECIAAFPKYLFKCDQYVPGCDNWAWSKGHSCNDCAKVWMERECCKKCNWTKNRCRCK